MVDYFSRYIEIAKLSGEASADIVWLMKSIIARHEIPWEIFTDNGPQFASVKWFADNRFCHKADNPRLYHLGHV